MRLIALVLALMSTAADLQGQVTKQSFGKTPDGTSVDIYTLKSGAIEARIITYGGIVQSLKVPDKNGKSADVVLGFDSIDGYAGGPKPNPPFFGAIIGRYGNRIAGGKFALDGKAYEIPKIEPTNALHGGVKGFDKVVWKGKEIPHGHALGCGDAPRRMAAPRHLHGTERAAALLGQRPVCGRHPQHHPAQGTAHTHPLVQYGRWF